MRRKYKRCEQRMEIEAMSIASSPPLFLSGVVSESNEARQLGTSVVLDVAQAFMQGLFHRRACARFVLASDRRPQTYFQTMQRKRRTLRLFLKCAGSEV